MRVYDVVLRQMFRLYETFPPPGPVGFFLLPDRLLSLSMFAMRPSHPSPPACLTSGTAPAIPSRDVSHPPVCLAGCGKSPPTAFSHRLEAQRWTAILRILRGYSSAMPLDVDHLSVRMPTGFSHSLLEAAARRARANRLQNHSRLVLLGRHLP